MAEDAVKVFISYSHKDEALRDKLDTHLSNLRWDGVISSWYDRQLTAGMEWDNKIKTELESADIILLLISPDFIASKYCRDIEIPMALQRHEAKQAAVVPIILRPFDWTSAPFAKLQAYPKDAKPVTLWGDQDEAFVSVAQGIRAAAQAIQECRKRQAEQKKLIREQYLKKVEEVLSDGVISVVERDTLDELQETLGLTPEEAKEIETHAYEPYSRYKESLNKYEQTLKKLIEKGYYPFSEDIQKDLEDRQRDLGLKPGDAARIAKPILDQAEAKHHAKADQLAEAKRLEEQQQQQQRQREEYEVNLERYRQAFSQAVAAEYPLSDRVMEELRNLQQQLALKNEDFSQIERSIREPAEKAYQQTLSQQAEAERQRQIELEQQAEKEEYKASLQQYEQEFAELIAARYPMPQFTSDQLKERQQLLGLSNEDVVRVAQPLLVEAEMKYQQSVQTEEAEKQPQTPAVSKKLGHPENITTWRSLIGHTYDVNSVVFHPDGQIIASGSMDNTIKLWDVKQFKEIRTLTGHLETVRSIAFSPDGKMLASSSDDKTIKLWDWITGQEIRTLSGYTNTVTSIAFSPDGKMLASGSDDKTIKLWDWSIGQAKHTLPEHQGRVQSMAFSPDGETLASLDSQGHFRLWRLSTCEIVFNFTDSSTSYGEVAISPDGQTLAVGFSNGKVQLWSMPERELRLTISAHEVPWGLPDGVKSVAFSPDGQVLATASGDGKDKSIKLWDVATGKRLQILTGHERGVKSVAFSPDGQTLISGSYDKTVRVWY